jgi:bacteriocin-like protein
MKKSKTLEARFTEMNREELTNISGGSFAYDLGRFIRYMGIYIYNGGGVPGTCAATLDYVGNMISNS